MNSVARDPREYPRLLSEQLDFIAASCDGFDAGRFSEHVRIATAIRVLLHSSRTSKPLLGQLQMLDALQLFDTAVKDIPGNVLTHCGLTAMVIGREFSVVPIAKMTVRPPLVPFEEWWNAIVVDDKRGLRFSRRDLVIWTSNQDGGAHVDPTLDPEYERLSRGNALRWMVGTSEGDQPCPSHVPAALRQIGYEVLLSLAPSKAKVPATATAAGLHFGGMSMSQEGPMIEVAPRIQPRRGIQGSERNSPCKCGSGKKSKNCCPIPD